jgi:hypothetical protein
LDNEIIPDGGKFSVDSPQGAALAILPAKYKTDWSIVESGGQINLPNLPWDGKDYE